MTSSWPGQGLESIRNCIGKTRASVVGRRSKLKSWLHRPCHEPQTPPRLPLGHLRPVAITPCPQNWIQLWHCWCSVPVVWAHSMGSSYFPQPPFFCLTEGAPPVTLQTQDGLAVSPARLSPHPMLYTANCAVECCLWVPCGPDFWIENIYNFCMRESTPNKTLPARVYRGWKHFAVRSSLLQVHRPENKWISDTFAHRVRHAAPLLAFQGLRIWVPFGLICGLGFIISLKKTCTFIKSFLSYWKSFHGIYLCCL